MSVVSIPNWPDPTIEIKLAPCSCGSKDVGAQGGHYAWIECNKCQRTGPEYRRLSTAAHEWNKMREEGRAGKKRGLVKKRKARKKKKSSKKKISRG